MKIFNYIIFALSVAGIILSVVLIIEGSQPCSGDGCMIHFLYLIGTPLLLISGIICYFTLKKVLQYRRQQDQRRD